MFHFRDSLTVGKKPLYYLSYRQNKNRHQKMTPVFMVGMTRLELATPRPPDVCATKLRYIPMQQYLFYQKKHSLSSILKKFLSFKIAVAKILHLTERKLTTDCDY